ncbi:hypothetical protein RIF29_01973 [Crotalaria pallida]|uniref:FAR1 domain-containing protein n=1 Tax=Crotalaria pallida TaxID=3830 RepID=A0AAN9P8D1_CROPI
MVDVPQCSSLNDGGEFDEGDFAKCKVELEEDEVFVEEVEESEEEDDERMDEDVYEEGDAFLNYGDQGGKDYYQLDSVVDLGAIMFDMLTKENMTKFHFASLEIAFQFYNEYAKAMGFSVHKHKSGRNSNGELMWKSFVCSRQGFKEAKEPVSVGRLKWEPWSNFRCGCEAEFRVYASSSSCRWTVNMFREEHNHALMGKKFAGRLRSHCGMTDADVAEMNTMRAAGIPMPKIFGCFGSRCGGIENVDFGQKHMYNRVQKERKLLNGDANVALKYLRQMASIDPGMYWKHEVDEEGRLLNLFWTTSRSEGLHSQMRKYVGCVGSLYDFLLHFERCVNFMRNNEIIADLKAGFGDPVMQTYVPSLEMFAARLYTRAIFYKFCDLLFQLGSVKVIGHRQIASCVIFNVRKSCENGGEIWGSTDKS